MITCWQCGKETENPYNCEHCAVPVHSQQECPICGEADWHYMDQIRDGEAQGFRVCKSCGYLGLAFRSKAEREAFYEDDYRDGSGYVNYRNGLVAMSRAKNHDRFLTEEYLTSIKGKDFLDIGCGSGHYLHYLRQRFGIVPHGTEATSKYVRYVNNAFGIECTHEPKWGKKYTMVMMYRVIEHLDFPDQFLTKVRDLAGNDGKFYFSVPLYEKILHRDNGTAGTMEYFYPTPHVSYFTRQSFFNLLHKVGFEIEKEDTWHNGISVIAKKADPEATAKKVVFEKWDDVHTRIMRQAVAVAFMKYPNSSQRRPDIALDIWPYYPDAYETYVSMMKDKQPVQQYMERVNDAIGLMPKEVKLHGLMAHLFEITKNYEGAVEALNKCVMLDPGNFNVYVELGKCMHSLGESIRQEALKKKDAELMDKAHGYLRQAVTAFISASMENHSLEPICSERIGKICGDMMPPDELKEWKETPRLVDVGGDESSNPVSIIDGKEIQS